MYGSVQTVAGAVDIVSSMQNRMLSSLSEWSRGEFKEKQPDSILNLSKTLGNIGPVILGRCQEFLSNVQVDSKCLDEEQEREDQQILEERPAQIIKTELDVDAKAAGEAVKATQPDEGRMSIEHFSEGSHRKTLERSDGQEHEEKEKEEKEELQRKYDASKEELNKRQKQDERNKIQEEVKRQVEQKVKREEEEEAK